LLLVNSARARALGSPPPRPSAPLLAGREIWPFSPLFSTAKSRLEIQPGEPRGPSEGGPARVPKPPVCAFWERHGCPAYFCLARGRRSQPRARGAEVVGCLRSVCYCLGELNRVFVPETGLVEKPPALWVGEGPGPLSRRRARPRVPDRPFWRKMSPSGSRRFSGPVFCGGLWVPAGPPLRKSHFTCF